MWMKRAGQWVLDVVKGALIGGGAILPGISGGVLAVAFGVYQPLMALLAHPIQTLRRSWSLFVPLLVGWVLGFLGLARLVVLLFDVSAVWTVALFVGLIAGMLPSLFRDANRFGASPRAWSFFTGSLIVLYALFLAISRGQAISIAPNGWWYFFCGITWGLSLVVPGLSSSSLLILLGLYQSLTAGIVQLDMAVLLPWLAGLVVTVALTARLVTWLLQRYYTYVYYVILGIVVASTLMIIPVQFTSALNFLGALASAAVGFAIAWGMDRMGRKQGSPETAVE